MKIVAIIPARGDSKRLLNKNILKLKKKSLITYTIEAAKKSKYIDQIIVSTDSIIISKIAKKSNIKIPFIRPSILAKDKSTSVEVVKHALNKISFQQAKYTHFILLQPTSPFRSQKHIDEAIELLVKKKADSIVSVCECDHPIEWTGYLPIDESLNKFLNKNDFDKRSQEFKKSYKLNGAIYLLNIKKFFKKNSFFLGRNSYAYKMSKEDSIDIDTNLDYELAKIIIKNKK